MIDSGRPQPQITLPDFRNLGVMLRILVIAEVANLGSLVAHSPEGFFVLPEAANWGFIFEAAVLATVLALFVLSPWLAKAPYPRGVVLVTGLVSLVAAGFDVGMRTLVGAGSPESAVKAAVLAALLAGLILGYFNWRQRVLSPALAEARLMALQSRIRPHFLFNSINTVLSLVRQDARQAEAVLLDISDLFRVLLAEPRSLVPLADEIRLARSYLEIEQLRLAERLRVKWDCAGAPLDASVPILLLQPLLENAVRHGVEPAAAGGDVLVSIGARDRMLCIEVRNSIHDSAAEASAGNRIALANIRERLDLHFDSEAQLRTFEKDAQFVVRVRLPLTECHPGRSPSNPGA
ncbi:sensor histidine kinase [Aromatoleum anaerobium]|uniref:Sensor histidine kinase n=1 Tax=Aromatoleum anaerobium TaxID=182180 RepID=A0ABX1PP69_9RHOO|nr:histidine kinase [Aromatoleum anaerobium]MCK0506283.1 histidine kinase [Aromatoleum anaerobium]